MAPGKSERAKPALVALSGCHISRPSAFDGRVEIVIAGPAPRGFSARLNDSLGVCLKIGGAHSVQSDGRKLLYPADSVCVRFPGCVWGSEVAAVGFVSIDIAPSLLPAGLERAPMRFLHGDLPDVRRFAADLERGDTALAQEATLVELIDSLSARKVLQAEGLREDTPSWIRTIRRAQEFLEASLKGNPSLDDLAAAAGANKYVLLRYFKKAVGVPPHGYLIRLRVERARSLLALGSAPSEVAAELGFSDQSHLGRHFMRVVGVTPAAYARQVRRVVPRRRL